MGSRFEHLAEVLLPHLINLIPNSAKVMASSGVTCIYFIIQVSFWILMGAGFEDYMGIPIDSLECPSH